MAAGRRRRDDGHMGDNANPPGSLGATAADGQPAAGEADAGTRPYTRFQPGGPVPADGPTQPGVSMGADGLGQPGAPVRGDGPTQPGVSMGADGLDQAGGPSAPQRAGTPGQRGKGPFQVDGLTQPGNGHFRADGATDGGPSWPTRQDSNSQSAGEPRPDRQGRWAARLEALGLRVTRGPGSDGPLRREIDGCLLGGVAAGIAKRTGFDVGLVRVLIIVAAFATSGFGVPVYVVAWLLIPAAGADSSIGARALADKRGLGLAAGLTSILILGLVIASALNAPWVTSLAVPIIVSAVGLAIIWRNAPQAELEYLRSLTDPVAMSGTGTRSRRVLRMVLALILVVLGLVALLGGHARGYELLRPLVGTLLLVGGIATALGPWWLRIARDLVAERQARIRAEERAEIASRVHDSVLQTLALIQRRAGDPQQVVRLARAQERELRAWLFNSRPPGSLDGQAATVADAVRLIQQDIEAQHGMPVEAVTVGDCDLDDDLSAMLAAAREATVNAAKWSDADVVSLFAEVEPDSVSLFVRDRGRGFDPAAVPDDRKGLAESVHARMARRGGSVTVRSAPGEGTEIGLLMPRSAAERLPRRS
jgi:signal transduction histidine kinase/phage shock protein PspC (stress-responsive transcriptional regulator)